MPGENPRFNPFLVKIFLIIALTLALLIPLHLVESLIGERTNLRATAMERVANGMGHAQRIGALQPTLAFHEGARALDRPARQERAASPQ